MIGNTSSFYVLANKWFVFSKNHTGLHELATSCHLKGTWKRLHLSHEQLTQIQRCFYPEMEPVFNSLLYFWVHGHQVLTELSREPQNHFFKGRSRSSVTQIIERFIWYVLDLFHYCGSLVHRGTKPRMREFCSRQQNMPVGMFSFFFAPQQKKKVPLIIWHRTPKPPRWGTLTISSPLYACVKVFILCVVSCMQ